MKTLLAFTLLALVIPQTQTTLPDASGLKLVHLSFEKKFIEQVGVSGSMVSNQPPVLDNSTILLPDRTKTDNPLIRDRMDAEQSKKLTASMHKNDGAFRPKGWVYDFQAGMKNDTSRPITGFIWAYRLPESSTNPQDTPDQEFLCNVRIEPGETKLLKVRSPIPRSKVVDVSATATPPTPQKPSLQDMLINQVKFADGTIWQRRDWNGTILLRRAQVQKLGKGKCMAL